MCNDSACWGWTRSLRVILLFIGGAPPHKLARPARQEEADKERQQRGEERRGVGALEALYALLAGLVAHLQDLRDDLAAGDVRRRRRHRLTQTFPGEDRGDGAV